MNQIICVTLVLFTVPSLILSDLIDLENVTKSAKEDRSSLVFVFDTTGSMHNDLKQLIEGAEMILDTALKHSNVISNFVFVPFHDPVVGPATVTRDKKVFIEALKVVRVRGGGDCPEYSLSGILMALNVSLPGSFIYVLTDATASDHRLVQDVLDAVQRKQSQVVFVLTGHCNDLDRPHYKVYQRIAAASFGQVFNLNKTSVHNVLDFVRSSIKGRTVNLGSAVNPAGSNYTKSIPIDSSLDEVTVSVSGLRPQIRVLDPGGQLVTGPPKLITTLDLAEAMVVKVLQPEAGNWTVSVGSEDEYSVKVAGLSNLTFHHGFSVHQPESPSETSLRPLQGAYNYMMITLTETESPINIVYAEILSIEGKTLFEIPLKLVEHVEGNLYLTEPFIPPEDLFFIAINGHDGNKQEIRRVGATTVQAKLPDVPYLTVSHRVSARAHEKVTLSCQIESLVPVTAMWSQDGGHGNRVTSIQSTILNYTIEDLTEETSGTYRCFAENTAGISKAYTEVILIVDPPLVTLTPENITIFIEENTTISCNVFSEAQLLSLQLFLNGILIQEVPIETPSDGYYTFSKNVTGNASNAGLYACIAENRGGKSNHTAEIKVLTQPTARILSTFTGTNTYAYNDIQLICLTENAKSVHWMAPNGTVVKFDEMSLKNDSQLEISNLTVADDGIWSCVALRGVYEDRDSINLNIILKPEVSFEGAKNLTLFFDTEHNMTCKVLAKPKPDVLTWYKGNQPLLRTTQFDEAQNHIYYNVLKLSNINESAVGMYSCVVENLAGSAKDSILVNVRRNMSIVQRFQDNSVNLYSNIELKCIVDSYPPPEVKWYHNGTNLQSRDNLRLSIEKTILTIDNIDFDDLGLYVCVADNGYERIVINGSLFVKNLKQPLLSKEPVRRLTMKGKSTLVTCRIIQGNPTPDISWQYKSDTSSPYISIPDDITLSDDKLHLLITNVGLKHNGSYRCVAVNVVGRDVYDIDLVVQFPPQLNSGVNKQNGPIEVRAGEKVSFSCNAIGYPQPLVIWTKDGGPITYTRNIYLTDNDLTIKKTTEYDSGWFTCVATSALGSVQRNISLIVYAPPTIATPDMDPEIQVLEGQLVELPCFARGVPKPQLEWRQNGGLIAERRKYIDEDFVLRFVANLTDFGEYTCVATNKYGNASFSYNIYIWVPPYIELPTPSIQVLTAANTTIQCNAIGFPIPVIVWEFQYEQLIENSTHLSFNNLGDLYINNATTELDGDYTCVAENDVGVDRRTVTLNVNEPPKILQEDFDGPYIATVLDVALTVSCRVTGKPKPFVIWSRDGRFLDSDPHYEIDKNGALTITSLSENLSGIYTCLAKNSVGQATREVEVQIYSAPSTNMMLSDGSHSTITVIEGTNRSLECPLPLHRTTNFTVKWYKDAKLISQGNLTLTNITRDMASTYACTVTNAITSAYTTVDVVAEWSPKFVNKVENAVEVVRGDDVVFNCDVDAKPGVTTQWLFNSKLMYAEDRNRLKILNLKLSNSGVYKCVVKNVHGVIQRDFTLDVLEPPFISYFDVMDVQLKEGSNATLDCVAKGSPAPNITWAFNNTNWLQLNASLHTYNISSLSEGLFRCDATNRAGTTRLLYRVQVLSRAVLADVTAFDGNSGSDVTDIVEVLQNKTIRISCRGTGNPAPLIQWLKNGNTVAVNSKGVLYADLVLTNVASTQSGVYTCMVSNEVGFEERDVNILVLEPPKISTSLFATTESSKSKHLELLSGQTLFLHCHPYGNPVPNLYWFKDGVQLRLFDDKMVLTDFGEIIVSNSVLLEHSGNYTCVARNKVGESAFSYLVDVLEPPPKPKETVIQIRTTHSKQLVLTCPAHGTPLPRVSWVKHPYTEVSEQLSPRVKLTDDNVTLTIDKTESTDAGKYSCIMSNKVGTTEVEYTVRIEKPPSIKGAMELNDNVTILQAKLGRSVALDCIADGEPKPTVTWFKNGRALPRKYGDMQLALDDNVLTIWRVSVSHAARYLCVAGNVAGVAQQLFQLHLTVPGKWTPWTQWSLCNVTCGLGYQVRSRACQYVGDDVTVDAEKTVEYITLDERACRGVKRDRRKCNMPACEEPEVQPRWSGWSGWSLCSSPCGVGTQTRSRKCRGRAKCYGDNMQIRKCPHLPQCSTNIDAANDILNSREYLTKQDPFVPEMTYELEPAFGANNPEVEEFYVRPETNPVFEVDVARFSGSRKKGPCGYGFEYNNSTAQCEDIDECLLTNNVCHATQACHNTLGAYSCGCEPGYAAIAPGQRCLDINECILETAACEYACVNVAGGYVCACPAHMRLHADKHTCIIPSSANRKHVEELDEDYLALSMEFPERYTKQSRN